MERAYGVSKKPNILRQFLLFCCIAFLWGSYRFDAVGPEWLDEFIAKPLLQFVPILIVIFFVERRGISSLGLTKNSWIRNICIGVGVGAFLVLESVVLRIAGGRTVLVNGNHDPFGVLVLGGFVSAATGFFEEIVYRGYFMNRFLEIWKNEYIANAAAAVLFALIHVPLLIFILHYTVLRGGIYIMQIFILGLVFGYEFAKTRSIVPSVISHAMWNFSSILLPPL